MNKVNLFLTAGMIISLSLLFNSCKKETVTTENCNQYVEAFNVAMQAYIINPTEETCVDYAQALKNYVDNCGLLTPAQRAEFEEDYNELNCHE